MTTRNARNARLASLLGAGVLATTFLAALLLLAGVVQAQAPAASFATSVSYQRCTESWAFACNQRTPTGERFGTARRLEHCTRYAFATDGTFTLTESFGLGTTRGRYRIEQGVVRMELLDDTGAVAHRQSLTLAADGTTLGDLSRVQR